MEINSPITFEKFKKMINNFNSIRSHKGNRFARLPQPQPMGPNSPEDHKDQTKWIWFSKEDIGRLYAVLNDPQYNKYEDKDKGIKMYFGIYEDFVPDGKPEYKDRLTLALVAAIRKEDGIEDIGVEGNKATDKFYALTAIENDGSMCPPGC